MNWAATAALLSSVLAQMGWLAGRFPQPGEHPGRTMKRELIDRLRHLAALWIACSVALAFATLGMLSSRSQFRHNGFRIFDNDRAAVSDGQLRFICRFLGCRR